MTGVLERNFLADPLLAPDRVHEVLARSILVDGLDFVLDLNRSDGSYLVDARDGRRYLDMFTFFASSALGMNHPALAFDDEFRAELTDAGVELFNRLREVARRHDQQLRSQLSDDEVQQLGALLEKLEAGVQAQAR